MACQEQVVYSLSGGLILAGVWFLLRQLRFQMPYGRYAGSSKRWLVPAKVAWFLQELPSFLVPVLLLLSTHQPSILGKYLLLSTFCLHYFHRTFVYSLLTKSRPSPLKIMVSAFAFCSFNGFCQGHYLLHCAEYTEAWLRDIRLVTGLILFFLGMAINIHSDYILRCLREPGDFTYKIPRGGLFDYISGANFFGEIMEWFGYAIATWSMPAFSFAFFTTCLIGPRAYHHHRYYIEKFSDYPRARKALIPFIF
ncbi:3-oxo-5-alpha-steroid 4-dehydrogenase 2b [Megalops cyprinoides]|uniref:3-oxo-5-alpha-steroid 4-dehydrogenase 2b n=1 Tax=Megalops cyprinoides TaxID=118141 RepID=UPI001863A005|nr:3-oxo-5-alpha-steroid 4-dehydrogenase 2b [Megalops cyprinoides]